MLEHLAPLLTHYANRINVTIATHTKGIQVTIAVMPCPQKVQDETLRQQLIQPIVVVGDALSISNQLSGLKDTLGEALANEQVNASVEAFNGKISGAKTDSKTTSTAKTSTPAAKPDTKVSAPAVPTVTQPQKSAAQSALDDFIC